MSVLDTLVGTPTEAGDTPSPDAPNFAAAKERIFGGGRKPTRRKPSRSEASPETETLTNESKELEKIFAGENWEEVSALYFNSRFAITGWDGFLLTDGQKKTLGLSLATTMKMLLKIDPGYIAMIVFLTNFGGLIAQKEVVYSNLKKQAENISGKGKTAS